MKKAIGLLTLAAIYCNFCSWAASPCKANTTAGQAESSEPQTECEASNVTRQINDSVIGGFYGNKFILHFDKQQIAEGKIPFVRLKFTNESGSNTYYLSTLVSKETFNSFTRASDSDIAQGFYESKACFSQRMSSYLWQYEVIYLDKAAAGNTSSMSDSEASNYTIARSGLKNLVMNTYKAHITCSKPLNKVKTSDNGVAELEWVKAWVDNFKNLPVVKGLSFRSSSGQDEHNYGKPDFTDGDTLVWKNVKGSKLRLNKSYASTTYTISLLGDIWIMSPRGATFATDMETVNPVEKYASSDIHTSGTITYTDAKWYAYGDAGVLTRVSDNFFESNCSDPNTGLRKYFFSEIATNGECQQYEHSYFPQPFYYGRQPNKTTNLNSDADDALSNRMVSISYPTGGGLDYSKCGLDLNVTVMSDTNTYRECNAIVLVRDDEGEYLRNAKNNVMYYLINGKDSGYKPGATLSKNAMAAANWWRVNDDGSAIPAIVRDLEFKQVDCGNGDKATYYVDVYVFEGNKRILSIDNLINGNESVYTFRYTHAFEPSRTMTGITVAEVAKTVASVKYYNLAGIESSAPVPGVNVKLTTYTDGTRQVVKIISH